MQRTDEPLPENICNICCMSCCCEGLDPDAVAGAGGVTGGTAGGMMPPVIGGTVRPPAGILKTRGNTLQIHKLKSIQVIDS